MKILMFLLAVQCLTSLHSLTHAQDENIRIRGEVTSEQGTPVQDGTAFFPAWGGDRWNRQEFSARTDESGLFMIEFPTDMISREYNGLGRGWVFHPDFNIAHFRAYEALKGEMQLATIQLNSRSEFRIQILDNDGTPVKNARIRPRHFDSKTVTDIIPESLAKAMEVVTNDGGDALLRSIDKDNLRSIVIETDQSGVHHFFLPTAAQAAGAAEIRLGPTGSVKIRVVLPEIDDAERAELVHKLADCRLGVWIVGRNVAPNPDDMGTFTDTLEEISPLLEVDVHNVVAGIYNVTMIGLEDLGWVPVLPRTITVVKDSQTSLTIPIRKAVNLSGFVYSGSKPVSGAMISIRYGEAVYQSLTVFTDEVGKFEAYVLPGKCRFQPIRYLDANIRSASHTQLEFEVPEQPEFRLDDIMLKVEYYEAPK